LKTVGPRWRLCRRLAKADPALPFFTQHNLPARGVDRNSAWSRSAGRSPAIRDAAVIQSRGSHGERSGVLDRPPYTRASPRFDRQIEQAAAGASPIFAIFASFPGSWSGNWRLACLPPLAPRGTAINLRPRYSSFSGIAPVLVRSGKDCPGFTTAGLVRSSFARRSRNGAGAFPSAFCDWGTRLL